MEDCTHVAIGLLRAIFADLRATFPLIAKSLDKDEQTLLSQVESRGLPVLTLDLPALGKHFDMCLDQACFKPSGLPLGRLASRRRVRPRLFSGLYSLVFDTNGILLEDADVVAVAALRQVFYAWKKLRVVHTQDGPVSKRIKSSSCSLTRLFATVRDFVDVEAQLPIPSTIWNGKDEPLTSQFVRSSSLLDCLRSDLFSRPALRKLSRDIPDEVGASWLDVMQRTADIITGSFGFIQSEDLEMRHGPGAVSEEFEQSKFEFPTWPASLERLFPQAEFAHANYNLWVDAIRRPYVGVSNPAVFSELLAVPKTQKGPRLIAKEPIAMQYIQQGVRHAICSAIEKTVLRNCVRFDDQRPSREAALQASKTLSHWTVDLSSASDRLSCFVVERVFRGHLQLLDMLRSCRTPRVVNNIDLNEPREIDISKFAAMGSATTFPVQSIVFAIAAISAVLASDGAAVTPSSIESASRRVRVYGDDIIVPAASGMTLMYLLEGLWLKVSADKTFTGPGGFRESCGMDAFRGVDVTPAYQLELDVQATPASKVSFVEASNNFYRRGWWHASTYLKKTSTIEHEVPVVSDGSGTFGFVTFGRELWAHLRRRWNPHLQVSEVRALTLRTRVRASTPEGHHALHQFWVEKPRADQEWSAGYVRRVDQRVGHAWNPAKAGC